MRSVLALLASMAVASGAAADSARRPWFSDTAASAVHVTASLPSTVRVCLQRGKTSVRVGATGPFDYMPLDGGPVTSGDTPLLVTASHGGVVVQHRKFSGAVLFAPARAAAYVTVNGRRYRGAVIVSPTGRGRFDVINHLRLDEYLYGVLPREMGREWPLEALKAQAVVSRTYVLANLGSGAGGYDVTSDVSHQVYGGVEDEGGNANRAVEETRGEIIVTDAGEPVEAYFHSSCGGRTETPENVWSKHGGGPAYSSVRDPYCKEDPYYRWAVSITPTYLSKLLAKAGLNVGTVSKVKIGDRSPSGRAATFIVKGSRRTMEVNGNRFRLAMGPERLRSTLLTDLSSGGKRIRFEGRGWGHGIGLCQWGARGRALAGHDYGSIVEAYYPEARRIRIVAP